MKKTTLLTLAIITYSFNVMRKLTRQFIYYVVPPTTKQDLESNEPGPMRQSGGVSARDYS